jgi:uncharacterized iron-regulated protein
MKRTFFSRVFATIAAASVIVTVATALADNPEAITQTNCVAVGTWLDPASAAAMSPERVIAAMARHPVVLLGESHDNAEHHRWQLHTLAALHAYNPEMVIGFEMFPRRVQAALDAWVGGQLNVESFLDAAEWHQVWGFHEELYLPLFHFARQNRIPMVALNVERRLISKVGREGWASVPAEEREGVSDPVSASQAYRESLARAFVETHMLVTQMEAEKGGVTKNPHALDQGHHDAADLTSVLENEDFKRFVEAQLTWDRAMAEGLAKARRENPDALVVGIIGRGHLEHGFGVPHQLAELGVTNAAVLLPTEPEAACQDLAADLADGLFVVARANEIETARPRPTLGVFLETTDGGVRVNQVVTGSVAEATKLAEGDIVTAAAGVSVARVSELVAVVQRQAPGTWLPLKIKRGDRELEVVAKFPTGSRPAE